MLLGDALSLSLSLPRVPFSPGTLSLGCLMLREEKGSEERGRVGEVGARDRPLLRGILITGVIPYS